MNAPLLILIIGKDQRMSQQNAWGSIFKSHFHLFKVFLFLLVPTTWMPPLLHADGKDTSHPGLLIGGSFERPPIHRFLEGSRQTILFPARIAENGVSEPLTTESGLNDKDWDNFIKQSLERASLLLATLDPVMVRDRSAVIQMAVLTSDNPMVASCILTRGFLQRFSAIFGPELLITIPSRNKIYVFPKLANRIASAVQTIHDDHLISPMPVSSEIFELSGKGLHSVGTLDPDEGR